METVKQSGLWNGQGKLSSHGCYVISLVDKLGIKRFPDGYYGVSLVDMPDITDIGTFK